jgi:type II secretory pathway component PulF
MERQLARYDITDYESFESETRYKLRPYALVKPGELAVFCREAMKLAGDKTRTAAETIMVLAETVKNTQLKIALNEISGFTARGFTIAGALGMYEHIFGIFFNRLILASEETGQLMDVLADLEGFFSREARLRHRLRVTLMYPFLLMAALWITVYGVLTGSCAVLIPAAVGLVLFFLVRAPHNRVWVDKRLLIFPLLRRLIMPICIRRLAEGVLMMLKYDVRLEGEESILPAIVGNYAMEEKILTAYKRIRTGQDPIAVVESVKHFKPRFPGIFYDELINGYRRGGLQGAMERISALYETQVPRAITRTAIWLWLLLGVVPGLLAACIFIK